MTEQSINDREQLPTRRGPIDPLQAPRKSLADYINSALGFGLTNAWWSDLPHRPGPLPHERINAFLTAPEILSAATRTGHRRVEAQITLEVIGAVVQEYVVIDLHENELDVRQDHVQYRG